jgi:hypothetical protein
MGRGFISAWFLAPLLFLGFFRRTTHIAGGGFILAIVIAWLKITAVSVERYKPNGDSYSGSNLISCSIYKLTAE